MPNALTEIIRLLRPQQWIKSAFVLVGILFGRAWNDALIVRRVVLVTIAFSLIASGIYAFNDLADREQDRLHPKKQRRPLAAGTVAPTVAVLLLAILWAVGLLLGYLAAPAALIILLLYLGLNIAYSRGLKHVVILDVFIIAAGFMLRILAGTLGVGIAPSQWLLLCGLMATLFLGFAKRRAEIYGLGDTGAQARRVLEHYSPALLDMMIGITATCVIITYGLYTMSPATMQFHKTENLIYTVPFVMYGIFRYLYTLYQGAGGGDDPAQEVVRDPHIILSVVGWLITTVYLIH